MKKLVLICFCLLILIGDITMSACENKNTISLNDFPQYKDFNAEIENILVFWDVNDNEPVNFTIDAINDVKFIMEKLQDKSTFKKTNDIFDAGHSYILLVGNDESRTEVSLCKINYNKNVYIYSNSTIYDYIYNIGQSKGVLK